MSSPLKIGYVPEHFAAPLFLAHAQNLYANAEPPVEVVLVAYPSGTGHMIKCLENSEIDVAIGLTEAWVAGIKGKQQADWYKIVGKYVETPLCWAISTGGDRPDIKSVEDLKGKKIGISRLGSGSQIMSYVLAQKQGWLENGKEPFEFVVLDDFKTLRSAVNTGKADAFMWEHFTTKKYHDSGELERIGEINTPWSSWLIAARAVLKNDKRIGSFLDAVNEGIAHFNKNPDEAVDWITDNLDYSEEDAREWMEGVKFVSDVKNLKESEIKDVLAVLAKAGVVEQGVGAEGVIVQV